MKKFGRVQSERMAHIVTLVFEAALYLPRLVLRLFN